MGASKIFRRLSQLLDVTFSSVTTNDSLSYNGSSWVNLNPANFRAAIGAGGLVPTTITVADTTDATSYVALFESATGDLGPKTDAGLTYDATTGMLTATGFTGPLTGNASTVTNGAYVNAANTFTGTNTFGTATTPIDVTTGSLFDQHSTAQINASQTILYTFDDITTGYGGLATSAGGAFLLASDGIGNIAQLHVIVGEFRVLSSGAASHLVVGGGSTSSEFRLLEPLTSGDNYTGFKSPALAGNVIYTLPTADGTSGQVLSTSGGKVLSWASVAGLAANTFTGVTTISNATAATTTTAAALVVTGGIATAANVVMGTGAKIYFGSSSHTALVEGYGSGTEIRINGGAYHIRFGDVGVIPDNHSADLGHSTAGNGYAWNKFVARTTGLIAFLSTAGTAIDSTFSRYGAGEIQVGSGTTANASGSMRMTGLTTSGAVSIGTTLAVTGATTITGAFTANGACVSGVQTLTGGGAVNITTAVTKLATLGTGDVLTLANGTHGQIKEIVYAAEAAGADTAILTPTTKTGFSTITFTAIGNSVVLRYFTTQGWMIVSNYGSTVA